MSLKQVPATTVSSAAKPIAIPLIPTLPVVNVK
jgi:hypothetical protein